MPPVVGALTSGLFGALFVVIGRRQLGLDDFAPVANLWTIWGLSASAITFSFQQATTTDEAAGGRPRLNSAVRLTLATAVVLVLVASYLTRSRLFLSQSLVWPAFAAVLPLGSAITGMARRQLAVRQKPLILAVLIASENGSRLAIAISFSLLGWSAPWFGLALLLGFATAIPVMLGPQVSSISKDRKPEQERPNDTLVAAASAGLLSHLLVGGAPLYLALLGADAATVSTLFLLLTSVRVPYLAVQGATPTLAVAIESRAQDITGLLQSFRAGGLTLAVVASAGGALAGPTVLHAIFAIDVSRTAAAAAAASACLAVTSVLITVAIIASGRRRGIAMVWAGALLGAIALIGLADVREIDAVVLVLTGAQVAVITGLSSFRLSPRPAAR